MKSKIKISKNVLILNPKLTILIVLSTVLTLSTLAFETSNSNYEFDLTVTSGKNNNPSSSNFETYVVVGDITGSTASSNFNTKVGFLITNPFINGEACSIDSECVSNICCSGTCASSCSSGSGGGGGGGGGGGSGGGGGGGGGGSTSNVLKGQCHSHFFSRTEKGKTNAFRINNENLDAFNITFATSEDLRNADILVCNSDSRAQKTPNTHNYFNITGDITDKKLETMTIYFKIPITSEYDMNSIIVKRLEGSWITLPTTNYDSDSSYYYYYATTDKVGMFAITYTSKETEPREVKEEITGEVVKEPEEDIPQAPPQTEPKQTEPPAEKKSLLGLITSILIMLFLIIIVLGLIAYRFAEESEERKMTYLEFQNIIKDIYIYLEQDDVRTAVALYKRLMPDYLYLINSEGVAKTAKNQIYKDFKLAYDVVNKRVKDINYKIPEQYWKPKK